MGDTVESSSQFETEEKTEPFPSSEYASRLHGLRTQESLTPSGNTSGVHLDELIVPSDKDIRLLVRPLRSRSVSPGNNDNCEWVALRTDVANSDKPQETVLAVTQTSRDIKFTVFLPSEPQVDGTPIPTLWCELYYEPTSDNQILLNRCEIPIGLSRIFPSPPSSVDGTPMTPGTPTTQGFEYTINPGTTRDLFPGTWRIMIGRVDVLDFRILERQRTVFRVLPHPPPLKEGSTPNSSGKRSFVADEDDIVGPEARRARTASSALPVDEENKEAVIMFLRPTADPLVFPLPSAARGTIQSHALLDMEKQDTVVVPGTCEIDSYKLTKREPIASTSLSTVFTGTVDDHPDIPPGSVITVKVIKTRTAPSTAPGVVAVARQQDGERIVIRQADTWLRELQSHEYLRHESIVRLYGGDARYLSLYMEHVDAKDLSKKGTWRALNSEYFMGDRQDACRILRDISGALNYIHGRDLVHNDVKPANILYSRERGAVLCDFGLSTETSSPAPAGGTPYYVPPEFIGSKLRGPPSDVWALGITMLYVLRKISFPDTRGNRHRAKPLYWMIADVNNAPSAYAHPGSNKTSTSLSAVAQMQIWLSEVNEAKEKLNRDDLVERLTYEMLTPNRGMRVTMKKVLHELRADTAE